jgi:hypothetical protein
MIDVMEDNKTQNGETNVTHGLITDYVGFKNKINNEIRRLCNVRKAWATEEATELLVFIVDEYVAQLPDAVLPDAGDLKELFGRYANMNAVNNRLAEAKLIDRNERKGKKVGGDLL